MTSLEHMIIVHNPHILIITETWLSSEVTSDLIIPPNYKMFRNDRGSRGGGVAIIVKSNISCLPINCELKETLFCKISFCDVSFMVVAVYRVPNAPTEFLEDLDILLKEHVSSNTRLIMAGDFNLPGIDWERLSVGSSEVTSCEKLLDIAFQYCLNQIVQEYTRITEHSKTLLDLVFLSDNISDYSTAVNEGISDHEMVSLSIMLNHRKKQCPTKKLIKDFQRANDVAILDHLEMACMG